MACILTDTKAFKNWQTKNFPTVNSELLAVNISLWQEAKKKTTFPTKDELNAYRKEHNLVPIENVFQEKSNDKVELTLSNYDRYNTSYNLVKEEAKPVEVAGTLASYTQELDFMLGVAMDQNNPNKIASRVNLIDRALRSDSLDSLLEEIKNGQQKDSIANQLISHLETIGITVLDRQDMEKYLKSHSIQNTQQAIEEQKEMDAIKQKAIADGTFMKAPNGKPTNLNERQWLQVRTKAFKNWFGDWENNPAEASKIVDENGEPLVVYHGSVHNFTSFDSNKIGQMSGDNSGFYFTNDKKIAKSFYAHETGTVKGNLLLSLNFLFHKYNPTTFEVFLNARNPYIVGKISNEEYGNREQIVTKAKSGGYDAVVFKGVYDGPTVKQDVRIVFAPNQIKSATDNNGNFSLTDDDIQAAYGREIYNSELKKQEITAIQRYIETLSKETDTSKGLWHIVRYTRGINKGKTFAYKFNTSLHQYEQNRKDKHDGFEILRKVDITNISEEQLNTLENAIKNRENIDSVLNQQGTWNEERALYDSDVIVNNRQTKGNNGRLDREALQGKTNRGQSDGSGTENKRESEITTFTTPQGEVYGFVDKDGNIYLDETKISPEHPIHEYTHLWDRILAQKNPKLWQRGVELMKQTPMWNEILNDENYGKLWQSKGITEDKLTNLVASEVHARFVGKGGEQLLNQLAKEKGQTGIIEKLKEWILSAWKALKSTFSSWSQAELDKLTLKDFNHMPVRDFAEGIKLNEVATVKEKPAAVTAPSAFSPYNDFNMISKIEVNDSTHTKLHRYYSANTRKHRVSHIARMFCNVVTTLNKKDPTKSRIEIIKEYTPVGLFQGIYNTFKRRASYTDDEIIADQINRLNARAATKNLPEEEKVKRAKQAIPHFREEFRKLAELDVFKVLAEEAAIQLLYLENIKIDPTSSSTEEQGPDVETEDNPIKGNDNAPAKEEFIKEGWMSHFREVSGAESLSVDIKKLVRSIAKTGKNDAIELDDLGQRIYLNPERVIASLYDLLKDMNTPEDMDNILKKASETTPWIKQIIRLLDKHDDIYSEFYQNFRKDYTSFWAQIYDTNADGSVEIKCKQLDMVEGIGHFITEIRNNIESGIVLNKELSVYNADSSYNIEHAKKAEKEVDDFREYAYAAYHEAANENEAFIKFITSKKNITTLSNLLKSVGINLSEEALLPLLTSSDGLNTFKNATGELSGMLYTIANKSNTLKQDKDYIENFKGYLTNLSNFLKGADIDTVEQNINELGKSYFCHNNPSYIGYLIKELKNVRNDDAKFKEFIEREYGQYEWFRKNGEWLCSWLEDLVDEGRDRKKLAHKVVLHSNKMEYQQQDSLSYALMLLGEYRNNNSNDTAWYYVPILGDASSAEFIRFKKYNGYTLHRDENGNKIDYRDYLTDKFKNIVLQEFNRIMLVRRRAVDIKEGKLEAINNFDGKRGLQFCFIPALNTYEIKGEKFLDVIERLASEKKNKELEDTIKKAIRDIKDAEFKQELAKYRSMGLLDEVNGQYKYFKLKNPAGKNIEIINMIKRQYPEIFDQELETLAFMLEHNNLDKEGRQTLINTIKERISESQGEDKAYIATHKFSVKDYAEEELEEFYWNTSYATSQIIELTTTDLAYYKNMEEFQKRYKEVHAPGLRLNTKAKYNGERVGTEYARTVIIADNEIQSSVLADVEKVIDEAFKNKRISKVERDFIISQFKKVNVADGQAYRSIDSYRKVMIMSGRNRWTNQHEESYKRIKAGNWTMNDFTVVYQAIKPYVYTQMAESAEANSNKMIKKPWQNKNSEAILLTIMGALAGPLNNAGRLRGIEEFMTENNIDVVQFKSTTKVGVQGVVNTNDCNTAEEVKSRLLEATGIKSGRENPQVIHTYSYNDYSIQTENPEHIVDHLQAIGTQFRKIIAADMPDGTLITVNGKTLTKAEWQKRYNALTTATIIQSFKEVDKIFEDPKNVEKALQEELRSNPRYGVELRRACTLNEDGEFTIPLFDEIQSNRIQALLNSIIRNRVTKQKIKGGSCIQTSCYGLTDELHIVFEGEGANKRIKEMEVYMPAYSKQLYEPLMDKDGKLDVNKLPDELRRAIGYRTPTEHKYSMVPIYIKGFLPPCMGSAIMLPAEITALSGSDFDIDHLYIMLPEFRVKTNTDWSRFKKDIIATDSTHWNKYFYGDSIAFEGEKVNLSSKFGKIINAIKTGNTKGLDAAQKWAVDWYNQNKKNYTTKSVEKVHLPEGFNIDNHKELLTMPKAAINNAILDLCYGALTSPYAVEQVLQIGNFNKVKITDRVLNIANSISHDKLAKIFKEKGIDAKGDVLNTLLGLDLDTLDSILEDYKTDLSPLAPTTQMELHDRNITGGNLISVVAVHNANHSLMQYTNLALTYPISIGDYDYQSLHEIYSPDGHMISSTISQFVGASVDAPKDNAIAGINLNLDSADVALTLLRLGVDTLQMGLILSQPIVKDFVKAFNKNRREGKSKDTIVEEVLWKYALKAGNSLENVRVDAYKDLKGAYTKPKALLANIMAASDPNFKPNEFYYMKQLNIGRFYRHLMEIASAMSDITQATRQDTSKGAAGPYLADNEVKLQKVEDLINARDKYKYPLRGIEIIDDNPNLTEEQIFNAPLPYMQAFYSLGLLSTRKFFKKYFPQLSPAFRAVVQSLTSETSTGSLDSKTIKNIHQNFMTYLLSSCSAFKGRAVRKQFIFNFPDHIQNVVNENPELAEYDFIKKLKVLLPGKNSCPISSVVFRNIGRVTDELKANLSAEWEDMLFSNKPAVRQLAVELFIYSYFRNGLSFGANSFANLAPNAVRIATPGYIESLRALLDDSVTGEDIDYPDFKAQYLRNHLNNRKFVPEINIVEDKGEISYYKEDMSEAMYPSEIHEFVVHGDFANKETEKAIIRTFYYDGVPYAVGKECVVLNIAGNSICGIRIDNDVALDATTDIRYRVVTPLGIRNQFIEYDVNDDKFMETVFEENKKEVIDPTTSEDEEFDDFELQTYTQKNPAPSQASIDEWLEQLRREEADRTLDNNKAEDKATINNIESNPNHKDATDNIICG